MNANLFAHIVAVAEQLPDKPFLIEGTDTVLRFGDIDARTGQLAAQLRTLGGKPGDRIVVQVEKSAENVLLYLAALRAGYDRMVRHVESLEGIDALARLIQRRLQQAKRGP